MNILKKSITISLIISLYVACQVDYESLSDKETKIQVFENEAVRFIPDTTKAGLIPDEKGIIHLTSGRMIIRKVTVPSFNKNTKAEINIILKSAGDRWDKSGSCFIITDTSLIDFMGIANKTEKFPAPPEKLEKFHGIVSGINYQPVIELMRFMTPFGVGYYGDSIELRKPVYIPYWEKEVNWTDDITDLLSELENEIWVGVWIDTWTKEGYEISATLNFTESNLPQNPKKQTAVLPLLNTVYYISPQEYPDLFSRQNIDINVNIPIDAKNVRLKYIVTGHGGHSEGDEFTKKENVISVNGKEIKRFIPWRDDCANYRRYNPHSGVWFDTVKVEYIDWKEHKYKRKTIEERIASSDYSRSNWCPGSYVPPVEIPLNIKPDKHKITFSIPEAQAIDGDKLNHWLVSAYLVWDKK
ncbi:MAG: N-glycanase [Bacteroidetes bacterium]|nr:MAG: N-glycanase [Bacteroidota bacterium]